MDVVVVLLSQKASEPQACKQMSYLGSWGYLWGVKQLSQLRLMYCEGSSDCYHTKDQHVHSDMTYTRMCKEDGVYASTSNTTETAE